LKKDTLLTMTAEYFLGVYMAADCRRFWLDSLLNIARPVLDNLSAGTLKQKLPRFAPDRAPFAPLEAFGRLLCGLAPWLEQKELTAEEDALRRRTLELVHSGLANGVDPHSADAMVFSDTYGIQPLVDAAFLAQGILRAPTQIVQKLDASTRKNVLSAFQTVRTITPPECNWLLFSCLVEAGIAALGGTPDLASVDRYIAKTLSWYKGDGVYGDGERFHADYYNSFVIHPMLLDAVRLFAPRYESLRADVFSRASRCAAILERLIAPDGTYPIVGRSMCYRFGAFHLLSQAALEGFLPTGLAPNQARCALTAALKRGMQPAIFDAEGWLVHGVSGYQPSLAEGYLSNGSLYLCCAVFLPLGLPPKHDFWSEPDTLWTNARVWSGEDAPADHCI
jgi:hypothetical protein